MPAQRAFWKSTVSHAVEIVMLRGHYNVFCLFRNIFMKGVAKSGFKNKLISYIGQIEVVLCEDFYIQVFLPHNILSVNKHCLILIT